MVKNKKINILILHNIRSILNIGALFRTCDAVGIDKVYLTGYSPTPLDRFGRKREDFKKASLGSDEFLDWEYKKNIGLLLDKLKKDGFKIFAIEQDKKSVNYKKGKIKNKNVFILGNEVRGISKQILDNKVDQILEIPMRGKKESLNVSTTGGIVLFHFL
ncbi:MAG: TrmH family RNA methyltransferase [Candidatus Pacebacteria bacterium]|nr:TrmH family RNA methyltransferase [Candidatus Paceibacterota bacterium]